MSDGHHRLAATKQRGFNVPVNLRAINARGEKLNELVRMFDALRPKDAAWRANPPRRVQ